MATKRQAPISPCKHCGRAYRVREKGSAPTSEWLGTDEEWQDVCNEQQDYCPCRSKQITVIPSPKPEQLTLF